MHVLCQIHKTCMHHKMTFADFFWIFYVTRKWPRHLYRETGIHLLLKNLFILETLRDGSLQMAYRFQIKICIPVFSMINKLNDSPSEYSFYGHHENAEWYYYQATKTSFVEKTSCKDYILKGHDTGFFIFDKRKNLKLLWS